MRRSPGGVLGCIGGSLASAVTRQWTTLKKSKLQKSERSGLCEDSSRGEQLYLGNGNITQPSANATPRKVKKTVAPYWSLSFGDSFEVSEKTMETQNAKIVRAVK